MLKVDWRSLLLVLLVAGLVPSAASSAPQAAIEGCVTDASGVPVPNLRIVAWDRDRVVDAFHPLEWDYTCTIQDPDDWMGEALTDASGCYHIDYEQPNRRCLQSVVDDCPTAGCPGHWDSSVSHRDTQWRPDIFIQAWIPTEGVCGPVSLSAPRYAWRPSTTSQVVWNRRTDSDLTGFDLRLEEYVDTRCADFPGLDPNPGSRWSGFVDLHTHPVSQLAFGGKTVHGAPDIGSAALPGSLTCDLTQQTAWRIEDALSDCGPSHGLWIPVDRECGDDLRFGVIRILEAANQAPDLHGPGFPAFAGWPAHDDITHQKMWIDWVRRAHSAGLRVMVALAVHSRTLAQLVFGTGALDDQTVGDAQIDEIKALVSRHRFMEIATDPDELARIVGEGKLAVILGVELDDMGNFQLEGAASAAGVRAEVQRLFGKGVRYVLPVHLIDNPLAGTAVYQEFFALNNFLSTGRWWSLRCGPTTFRLEGIHQVNDVISEVGRFFGKDLVDNFIPGFSALFDQPIQPSPVCPGPGDPPSYGGYLNARGLSSLGVTAIQEMMRLGMMIDIDHMSERTIADVLAMAWSRGSGYPLNSGHTALRGEGGVSTEQGRTEEQYGAIAGLGGLAGVGWARGDSADFLGAFSRVAATMGHRNLALGTDANGLSPFPGPRVGARVDYRRVPMAKTGLRRWDYNREGVAHYGLVPDFLLDVKDQVGGDQAIQDLYAGAFAFYNMWLRTWQNRTFRCPDLDGNPCTEDVDTYDLRCFVRLARPGTECGGGRICNELAQCVQPPQCPPSAELCVAVDWNPTTGQCEQRRLRDGTACGRGGICVQGQCSSGQCPQSNEPCETSEWDPDLGQCVPGHLPEGAPCGAGGICQQGQCGVPACPPSQRPCETSSWNPVTRACEQGYEPDGTRCGSGGVCFQGQCAESECPWDPRTECLREQWNPVTGRCEIVGTLPQGAPCGSDRSYACDGQGECRFVPEPAPSMATAMAFMALAFLHRRRRRLRRGRSD